MKPVGLPIPHPKATKENRGSVLTGTDMKRLASGEWLELWEEKLGRRQPEDLTFKWKPRLGLHTESIHAWWHGLRTGCDLLMMEDRPHYMPHVDVPAHHAATFDRWVPADDCPLEMKHTNARSSLRECAEYNMAQIQWQLHVSGKDRLRFSVICGNEEPDWGYVERDDPYLKRLLRMADQFWDMVETETPPPGSTPDEVLPEIAKTIRVNGTRPYDFSKNNAWCVKAARFIETKPLAEENAALNTELKGLVPADASEVTGAGVRIARDKKGSLRLTIKEDADA